MQIIKTCANVYNSNLLINHIDYIYFLNYFECEKKLKNVILNYEWSFLFFFLNEKRMFQISRFFNIGIFVSIKYFLKIRKLYYLSEV